VEQRVVEARLRAQASGVPVPAPSISGRITQRGRPLPGGTVTFHFADKRSFAARVLPDGTYRLHLPEKVSGAAKVTVSDVPPPPPDLILGKNVPPPPPDLILVKNVPSRYRDPAKSGLSCTVRGPNQTFDIELDDGD
jgi:hypothetical protein